MADNSMPPLSPFQLYNYIQLPEGDEIRLLRLFAYNGTKAVSCSLEVVNLNDQPEYEAISYVWGNPVKTHYVVVDDEFSIYITATLNSALQDIGKLISPGESKLLWADAICINQSDVFERNHQVWNMARIYGQAQLVVTHIPSENPDRTASAMQLATEICDADGDWTKFRLDMNDTRWPPLLELLDAPWPSRIWILQECLLNNDMAMVCGGNMIPWTLFPETSLQLISLRTANAQFQAFSNPSISSFHCAQALIRRKRYLELEKLSLGDAVSLTRTLNATDPRDKVYAILALIRESDRNKIPVDYNISIEELCIKTAARILDDGWGLDRLLGLAEQPKSVKLPSWVPDLSQTIPMSWILGQIERFECASEVDPVAGVDETGAKLNLSVAFLGRLKVATSVPPSFWPRADPDAVAESSSTVLAVIEWLEEQIRCVQKGNLYPDALEATSKALCLYGKNVYLKSLLTHERPKVEFTAYLEYLQYLHRYLGAKEKNEQLPEKLNEQTAADSKEFFSEVTFKPDAGFGITEEGHAAWLPGKSNVGDFIAVVPGCRVTHVLRKNGNDYTYVGEAYVADIMCGELVEFDATIPDFRLISPFKTETITIA